MRHHGSVLDLTDYELLWPPDLFTAEARRILNQIKPDPTALDLLLREAFRDSNVADGLTASLAGSPWDAKLHGIGFLADCVRELADRASEIRQYSDPKPYWPQRHGRQVPHVHFDQNAARHQFHALVADLEQRGYLDKTFPRRCVDDQFWDEIDPSIEFEKRLGLPGLWPLKPSEWDDDTFYGLIEVFHDLVSRPRVRNSHDFGACGWHYSQFATTPGQEVYRWRVNELLAITGINYRLADEGEDRGRLVEVFDDGRAALVAEVTEHSKPSIAARVQHAISLFRGWTATIEDKRSAVVSLAGILEERRQLISHHLLRKDEDALFRIANEFSLRHHNERQRRDYDPAFLDWTFWWYLATVELTNRLIAAQAKDSDHFLPSLEQDARASR